MPYDLGQEVHNIRVDLNFVVIGSHPTGRQSGKDSVRVRLLEEAVLGAIGDRIGLNRFVRELGRERKDGAGVEPPTQEDTDGNVAD